MSGKVMVVDDEADIRALLRVILNKAGFETLEAEGGVALKNSLSGIQPDLMLLDLKLPDGDGLDLLPMVKREWPDTEVIMLTGHGSLDTAVSAIKLGAYDFQQKPFDPKALLVTLDRALEHKRLKEETSSLRQALSTMSGGESPTFRSMVMKDVLRTVEKLAPSDASILLTGESGCGKEVIADLIHSMSPRSKDPIVKVSCAAMPRESMEREMFGVVSNDGNRDGLFQQARAGTLLLDEICEMPMETQALLLRVLQDRQVKPLGGTRAYSVECRIVAITNQDVKEAIKQGRLREDLFYRISQVTIEVPPLRSRREDILPLAKSFMKRYAAQANHPMSGFTPDAEKRLRDYDWPGNVRQLQNIIQQAVLLADASEITVDDLAISSEDVHDSKVDKLTLMQGMERNAIIQMLKETGGNKLETAKRLGIGRQTLYNKIKAYEIET